MPIPSIINDGEWYAGQLDAVLADNASVVSVPNVVSGAPPLTAVGTITLKKSITQNSKTFSVFRFGANAGYLDAGDNYDLGVGSSVVFFQVAKKNAGDMCFFGKSEAAGGNGRYAGVFSSPNDQGGLIYVDANNNVLVVTTTQNPNGQAADTEYCLYEFRVLRVPGAAQIAVYKNKTLLGQTSFTDESTVDANNDFSFKIGRFGVNGIFDLIFQGDIAHNLICLQSGDISANDRTAVEDYLGEKYGLAYFSSPGDTTPPTVSISAPAGNATVSGVVSVTATVADNSGTVASVLFKLDGNPIGSADTSAPFAASLNTTAFANGNHILTATAVDPSGNQTTSAPVTINIQNAAPTDTTPPSDVVNLTATKIGDGQINIDSSAATDNSGAAISYVTQRATDANFSQNLTTLTSTAKAFPDYYLLPPSATTTFYYRRKAKDVANNLSVNWSNTASITITVDAAPSAPTITSNSPLPSAQIGQPYSFQLQKTGGAGTWSVTVQGNLPNNAVNSAGLLSIPSVGNANYSFTVRFADAGGLFVDKAFSIPVSELALISFCHKRPLDIEFVQTLTVDESLDDDEEASEDAPLKRNFNMNAQYVGGINDAELWEFLYEHRLRKKFLWHNPDRNETLIVKMIKLSGKRQMLSYGEYDFTLQHKHGD